MKRCWLGGDSQRTKGGEVCLQANTFHGCFLEMQDPCEKWCFSSKAVSKNLPLLSQRVKDMGCLFPLYWREMIFCFCLGTNHKVRHLPAVILTLFLKVRPHVKPSHPWQGKPKSIFRGKTPPVDFSCRDLWSPLSRQIKKEHANELRIPATYIENDTERYLYLSCLIRRQTQSRAFPVFFFFNCYLPVQQVFSWSILCFVNRINSEINVKVQRE